MFVVHMGGIGLVAFLCDQLDKSLIDTINGYAQNTAVGEIKNLIKLREGFKKKKKNLEFSRFGLTHPPHPCNREKSGKKNKNFMLLKCFLSNFETLFFF